MEQHTGAAPGFVWEGARHAADRVMSIVNTAVPVASVVDVGCGVGVWLAAALAQGAGRAVGLDAPYVDQSRMVDQRIAFSAVDLEEPIRLGERFDLAVSLEVAEHLSPGRAEGFVADLCALSDCVLFGAAIPRQGGIGHLNEQWQSYWAGLFARHGYRAVDAVRPLVAGDRAIQPWYRQNTLLYLSPDACRRVLGTETPPPVLLDIVVPDIFLREPNGRERLRLAAGLPAIIARRLLGRRRR